ncbi:glycosyltransferase family 4 protein [Streptomyces sp. NPDC000405]|uniref:glycosyltransferase family 4 protein n=1 Tax=Streptomyces sp. NPDC000405 TaxID=3161033 RepID=UPI00398CD6D4
MPSTPALLYCAVNGITNCTNGIGRQTKTLLATLEHHYHRLADAAGGPFTPYLAVPEPGPATWDFNTDDLVYARTVVEELGGRILPLPYDTEQPLWQPSIWNRLSSGAAGVARMLAAEHRRVLAIAVDTPFAGLTRAASGGNVDVLLALFSTAKITERPSPNPAHVAWEQQAIAAVNRSRTSWIAGIGTYLTSHLRDEYGLDTARIVPWPSGLHLAADDLAPMTAAEAETTARRFGIPTDRPIVAAVGRTDRTKGLDQLIEALAPLHERVHLAAIAVRTDDERATLLDAYRSRCAELGLRSTWVGAFHRNLPRALAALPATRVMSCPSRGETLANIVFETALWAKYQGAVVLVPDQDGFPEQITHGRNGLLYEPGIPHALTQGIEQALALTETERGRIRTAAAERVRSERDAAQHLATLLARFWHTASASADTLTGHPAPDTRPPRSQAPTNTTGTLEAAP